jgi:hypothetical protein
VKPGELTTLHYFFRNDYFVLDAGLVIIPARFLLVGIVYLSLSFQADSISGHTQQEHETSHGSMSRTRWAVDGPEGSCIELGGHKFAANDDGAPMLCNTECSSMGRHLHIDYCRGDPHDPEALHIDQRMVPDPERAKDWITHGLYWRRMGESVTRTLLKSCSWHSGFKGNRNVDPIRSSRVYIYW